MGSTFGRIQTREVFVERYLRQEVERHRGMCWKFVSPGRIGVPDRIVFLPGKGVIFVEVKAPGKKPRPIQEYVMDLIRKYNIPAEVVSTKEEVDEFIQRYVHGNREVAQDTRN